MKMMNNLSIDRFKTIFFDIYPDAQAVYDKIIARIPAGSLASEPKWLKRNDNLGISLYVDLYAGDFKGLIEKIPYWQDMDINLVHLLPIQKVSQGENDGGYAVADYRDTNARFGTLTDFKAFITACDKAAIRVCIDYVINHTADSHQWAKRALAGEQIYRDYYYFFSDQAIVDAYESTLPEVFPKVAPGNFTYLPNLKQWVMTTFYSFQWDLDYRNPHVFYEMLDILMYYGKLGVKMIRLDAIPYIWKELGTNCRNLDNAHRILQMFRIVMAHCYPDVALLGEAIIYPPIIPSYFGEKDKPECHLLYHASYMVETWNALATADARFLDLPPDVENANWIRYVRCHDDIGWGLNPVKLEQFGIDAQLHKEYLMAFYKGDFAGSFARGDYYEYDRSIMDARNTGTMASLCGLENALVNDDQPEIELSLRRITLLYALMILRSGIPMLYAGDDWGILNDNSYLDNPDKKRDARWLHRVAFPWQLLNQTGGVHWQVNQQLRQIIAVKRRHFKSEIVKESVLNTDQAALFALQIDMVDQTLYLIANLSADELNCEVTALDDTYQLKAYDWRLINHKNISLSYQIV